MARCLYQAVCGATTLLWIGAAIFSVPIVRSLPEAASMRAFLVLMPLGLACGVVSVIASIHGWTRYRQNLYRALFVLNALTFGLLYVSGFTDWLWPYARP